MWRHSIRFNKRRVLQISSQKRRKSHWPKSQISIEIFKIRKLIFSKKDMIWILIDWSQKSFIYTTKIELRNFYLRDKINSKLRSLKSKTIFRIPRYKIRLSTINSFRTWDKSSLIQSQFNCLKTTLLISLN